MRSSSPQCQGRRAPLGSPIIPINPPAAYLRHRVAAARAHRSRRRASRLHRLLSLLLFVGLYLAIGREVVQLTRAKASLFSTQTRAELHGLSKDVEKLAKLHRAAADPSLALPDASQIPVGDQSADPDQP